MRIRKEIENSRKSSSYSYQTSHLTRTFHTNRDEEAAKPDEARQAKILSQGCMSTYRPSQNSSLTQHSSDFSASAVGWYEIFGLTSIFNFLSSEWVRLYMKESVQNSLLQMQDKERGRAVSKCTYGTRTSEHRSDAVLRYSSRV